MCNSCFALQLWYEDVVPSCSSPSWWYHFPYQMLRCNLVMQSYHPQLGSWQTPISPMVSLDFLVWIQSKMILYSLFQFQQLKHILFDWVRFLSCLFDSSWCHRQKRCFRLLTALGLQIACSDCCSCLLIPLWTPHVWLGYDRWQGS